MTRHFSELNAGCMSFENGRTPGLMGFGEHDIIGIRCPGRLNTS
jgi:hypothetical protein